MSETTECSVEGCDRPVVNTRGWCALHYQRWRRTGDPLSTRKCGAQPRQYKFDENGKVVPVT